MCDIMFKLYFLRKLLTSITLILTFLLSISALSLNMKIMFCIKMIMITMLKIHWFLKYKKFEAIACQLWTA